MPRRWKLALAVTGVCGLAMAFMFTHPAAAASRRTLSLTDKIAAVPAGGSPRRTAAASPVTTPAPDVLRATLTTTRTYTVRPGDSLALIARRFYGSAKDWTVLYWRNKKLFTSPSDILPGVRLVIPPLPERIPAAPVTSQPPGAGSPGGPPGAGGPPSASTPYGARAAARGMLARYGWRPSRQFGCLDDLWARESGWNWRAENPYSGAYGIPQALPGNKMASAGSDWQTNAVTQIRWGLGYIKERYGSPCGAWANEVNYGSYAVKAVLLRSGHSQPGGGHGRAIPARLRAYGYARTYEKGCPYVWGGNGPCGAGYDCSGLVQHAYMSVHMYLPRTVEDMVQSGMLVRVLHPRRGDLAVWFSGSYAFHTELVAYKTTWIFGAQQTGTYSGATRSWGDPVYYRVA